MMPVIDATWVPDACTLPTVEQPLRTTAFDDLFGQAVTAVDRVENQRARLVLRPDPAVAARVADLMVRETDCCSFFEFTLSATGGALTLDVTVPPAQIPVLDVLLDRARTAAGLGSR